MNFAQNFSSYFQFFGKLIRKWDSETGNVSLSLSDPETIRSCKFDNKATLQCGA
jgi:hypothetical protein